MYCTYVVYFECSTEDYCYSPNFGFGLDEGLPPPYLEMTGCCTYETHPLDTLVQWCQTPPLATWEDGAGTPFSAEYDVLYVCKVRHEKHAWIDVTGDKPDCVYRMVDGKWVLSTTNDAIPLLIFAKG